MSELVNKEIVEELFDTETTIEGNEEEAVLEDEAVETEEPEYNEREIAIMGEITPECISKYVFPIIAMNKEDDLMGLTREERQPITLYISCVGGCVTTGLAIIDTIVLSKTPIKTVVVSNAYSMGGLIAMAGHERYALPHASFLIHDGGVGMENSTAKFKDFFKFLIRQEESLKEFILENTKIPKKLLEKNYNTEWYMTAKEALKYGLIDEILEEII